MPILQIVHILIIASKRSERTPTGHGHGHGYNSTGERLNKPLQLSSEVYKVRWSCINHNREVYSLPPQHKGKTRLKCSPKELRDISTDPYFKFKSIELGAAGRLSNLLIIVRSDSEIFVGCFQVLTQNSSQFHRISLPIAYTYMDSATSLSTSLLLFVAGGITYYLASSNFGAAFYWLIAVF